VSARGKARKRAVDLLFEADVRGVDPAELLAERAGTAGVSGYTQEIVEGFLAHRDVIDEHLATHSHGWSLERMPAVDRSVLRVGTWELLFNPDVPSAVAIDEAVNLASTLSTDASGAFVNGLLARILDGKQALAGRGDA
jgi:N utilization substance protein B